MTTGYFHPATLQLLRLQTRGRRRRIWARFCQTRRLVLSAVACILAVVWLGNAAMTVWLRETASAETLRALLSFGLVLYAGWHLAKAAFFRPESPFDWTSGQRELMATLPLRPRDLVAFQIQSVTVTTIVKAGLFTLLLWPDLRCVPLGCVGLLLAMLTLELLRMAVDITTWGMSRRTYLIYRTVVVTGLVAAALAMGAIAVRENAFGGRINVGEGLLTRFREILVQCNASALGHVALPFRPFVDLVLADGLTATQVERAIAASVAVLGCSAAVVGLYAAMVRRVAAREKLSYVGICATRELSKEAEAEALRAAIISSRDLRLRRMPRWSGAGALVWRQLVGARRQWGAVTTAMIAPAVLACAPGFVIADPQVAFMGTTGTLAFYTFLLLPTALRFDLRRDLDRMATLKGLPITPLAAVVGQTMAPVLIATLFQAAVLAFAVAARSLAPQYLLTAMLVMIPLNVLVFALDNLIYLLYPYRVQQEGLEIFLRTILTFTGKGLLFAVGLQIMALWAFAAAALAIAVQSWIGITISAATVFVIGMIAGPWLLAALLLWTLAQVFRTMNPIEDLPR